MDRIRKLWSNKSSSSEAGILNGSQPRATNLTNLRTKPRHNAGSARPSLLDKSNPFFTGIQRFGTVSGKLSTYLQDPFHTLLNLPWWKFITVFFCTYVTAFCFWALLYWAFPSDCIQGIDSNFAHALWMSSRTASTIGYNDIVPQADCPGVNLLIILQVICTHLVDFIMLGLVFARFSAPYKRASSIRFTTSAIVQRHSSGYWCLSFRVANIRKHQLLKPEIKMLATAIDSITPSNYIFEYLEIENVAAQMDNMQLGFPANVVHVIRPGSPLWMLSLAEMEARMMEVLVFMDGIDAMTSKQMQARKSYHPNDIKMNEAFLDMHLEMRNGRLGLDFSQFDTTVFSTDALVNEYQSSPHLRGMSMPDVQHHLGHMRHLTFKRLTEQHGGKGGAAAGAAAGASAVVGNAGMSPVAAGSTGGSSLPQSFGAQPYVAQRTGANGVELGPVRPAPPVPGSEGRDVHVHNPFAAAPRDQGSPNFSALPL